jgi:hypothetical protein
VELIERVQKVVGQAVLSLRDVPGAGGYTPVLRRIAELEDGSTVFVKASIDDETTGWIQAERAAYELLGERSFLPRFGGGDDEGLLVLEDLRHGYWPTPWREGDVGRVFALLDEIASAPVPSGTRRLTEMPDVLPACWSEVSADPRAFLDLGACSPEWFESALQALVRAEDSATLDGESIVHYDVRSDNVCLLDDRAVLVDWNFLCHGNPEIDRVFFAQTVTVEGGPPPWEMHPEADPALVAAAAGFFAVRAPGPPIPTAPAVRGLQRAQLEVCLAWSARLLDLPPVS